MEDKEKDPALSAIERAERRLLAAFIFVFKLFALLAILAHDVGMMNLKITKAEAQVVTSQPQSCRCHQPKTAHPDIEEH